MTSYGYIIMIIVDSCIIWFQLDCIMQLKKSYFIATNVCGRKSATTFGDLPDCWKFDSIALAGVGAFLSNKPDSLALIHLLTHWPLGGHNVILKM